MLNREQAKDRLSYILCKEDMERVELKIGDDGIYITLDVHGWSMRKTEKILGKIITLQREAFCINVVHGYSHSIVIKTMITNFKHDRLIKRRGYNQNPGITFMRFKAAA